MFNWIKNLTKAKPPTPGAKQDEMRQTRVVKRVLPASLRQAEEEAAAREAAEAAAAPKFTPPPLEEQPHAKITLTPNLPKAAPSSIPFPGDSRADEEAPQPQRAAVRLTGSDSEGSAPAASPMVRLTSAKKKPTLSFDSGAPATASRQIILTVGDFISRIPPHFVDENAVPSSQEVRFDADDLYSDMTKGRATVPLSIIAEVLPALFRRRLSSEEDIEIQLPLPKIVAQMSDLLTRPDQEAPETFEEVETPFLKAAQRDQEIHKVSGAVAAPTPAPRPAPTPAPAPAAPAPRQQAPISFSAPAEAATPVLPARPKPVGLRLSETPTSEPTPPPASKAGPRDSGRRVTVRVRPLIQAMPQQQREALLGSIPEDSEVDLPLDQIQNQLSSGRVSLSAESFSQALDPSMRQAFKESFTGTEVPLSLSEIVKNLPNQSLDLRGDQHVQEVDPNEFKTPFNTTPDTVPPRPFVSPAPAAAAPAPVAPSPLDAKVHPPSSPLRAKPLITPAITNYTTRKLNSTANKFPSPMHAALSTQDPLDAKKVVKLASALPGVASLTIITEDGLALAGNLPSFMDPEGFSAMAPQLHRKMGNHARDMKLGELKHLSLSTDTHTVTIFTGSGMTIAVLHQNQSDLGHGVKEKFIAIVDGLAKQYGAGMAAH